MAATQSSRGLHGLLSRAWVYRTYQQLIGAHHLWRAVIDELALAPGDRLLDLGCGPGDVVRYLGQIEYVGIDVSADYIGQARERYGDAATFVCADVGEVDPEQLGSFDAVLVHGVLHHVDDEVAHRLLDLAARVLRPGGHVTLVDPARTADQPRVARFLIDHDRGRRVRTPDQYAGLARVRFGQVDVRIEEGLLRVPYTLAIVDARKPLAAPSGTTRVDARSGGDAGHERL